MKEFSYSDKKFQIEVVGNVYVAKLDKVQWSQVVGDSSEIIASIGDMLFAAIAAGIMRKSAAEEGVHAG